MAEIFSEEWMKLANVAKKKSLSSTTNLEELYILAFTDDASVLENLKQESNELSLNLLSAQTLKEAQRFLNTYGSKIIIIITTFTLDTESGKLFRQIVQEGTNDTPYAIISDLPPFELSQMVVVDEFGNDLAPHVYLSKVIPNEEWYNFLRFDGLTRVSLLGEEVKLRGAFVQNAANIIQQTEELVLSLEENPQGLVLLDSIFGNIHTLKGGSSFLQPKNLERFMHKFEDLINRLRSGENSINSELITIMLNVLDKAKELVDDLTAELHHYYEEGELEAYFTQDNIDNINTKNEEIHSDSEKSNSHDISVQAINTPENDIENEIKEKLINSDIDSNIKNANSSMNNIVLDASNTSSNSHANSLDNLSEAKGRGGSLPPSAPGSRKKEEKNLKVPISLLDTLMHISGELTVVRNMINKLDRGLKVRYSGDRELERMSSLLEELHKLNGSLQTHILDLRKVPLKDIVAPLNRVVRDLSKQLDKIVSLKVQGAELRIDTAIAEILNNTLIHIVRNSIDHGLETSNERTENGKPSGGTLTIEAFEENDNVHVRIKDDGRGLQTERIRNRAIERGLLTEEKAKTLKDEEIWPLIFAPGFSTAEKVTDISGRGIGMSAVKEAVEAIGGAIEIESIAGMGSTMTLSMPLPKSVLITRCLFILISGMQIGIPNENVYRIVHLDGQTDTAKLTKIEDSYVLSMEEELIPVVQLDQILGTSRIEIDEAKVKTIAVLRSSKGASLGVIVNDVLEFEDAVVKPFTDHLKAFDIFYGTTFLGDGSIGLIFRVDGLVETYRMREFYHFNINFKGRDSYFQEASA